MQIVGLESNLWKYFLMIFSNRRNFIPVLSVYYLTLPHAAAHDIGIYTGIGYIASLIMQMPSGYIADHYGQKTALIISKILLILSSSFFLIADDFWLFSLGAICMSLGTDAFATGTTSSFLKGTLEKLGKGKEYRHIAARISGNVALTSVVFIVGLPFLTEIDIRLPLLVGLAIDIFGFLIALSLTPVHTHIDASERKGIMTLYREMQGTGFFPFAFFSAVISGFLFADNAYRSPYLIELGYPLIYIGFVMGLSRVVWWCVGRSIKIIEKYISFRLLILIELILFPIYYIGIGYISNPWLLGAVFSLVIGWYWGRNEIYTDYLIDRIVDNRYRATLLSMKAQITGFVQIGVVFGAAGLMSISYAFGFQMLGVASGILLSLIYFFGIRRSSLYTVGDK